MKSINYEKDILNPPEYMDINFFEEVVEYALFERNVEIQNVYLTMGSSVGDNYCSQVYRAKIEYKSKNHTETDTLSIIIKSMPHSDDMEFVQDLHSFMKERIIYNSLLPRMELLVASSGYLGAKLYHSLKHPVNTLVFEDLRCKNFEMASREKGLDEAHACLVMQKLGQFHAASMVLAEKDNAFLKCYQDGMLGKAVLERVDSVIFRLFSGNADATVALVQKWQGFEKITEKLQTYKKNFRENLYRSQAPISGEIKVLNHGDLWVNNMLFKYNEQHQPEEVIFVDYQLCVWTSPGIDLNYFFYTSLQLDILKNKREDLVGEYYNSLSRTLQRLNCSSIPSYQRIREEVQKRESFGLFTSCAVSPIVCMDREISSDTSFGSFKDEEFSRKKTAQMFSSQRLAETLKYTLKYFDKLGVLD